MVILGIETSCDETSLALLEANEGKLTLRKNLIFSQIKTHAKYGGVVPEVAARAHVEKIAVMLKKMAEHRWIPASAGMTSPPRTAQCGNDNKGWSIPDVIAVTAGPGLATALLVGVETARTLAYLWKKPLVAVNHLAGHIYANWLPSCCHPERAKRSKGSQDSSACGLRMTTTKRPAGIKFPALCLIISGGHTELILMKEHLKYRLIGQTHDDAVGECFDKVGKILGLSYPGGPEVAKHATKGNPKAIKFPRPMIDLPDFDFSFSGLKTAVLYYAKSQKIGKGSFGLRPQDDKNRAAANKTIADICASFQQACIDVIITKTMAAAKKYKVKTILLGGGVAANQELQRQLRAAIKQQLPDIQYSPIPARFCGDNAAMIAAAGYFHVLKKQFTPWEKLNANPNWDLA